MLHRKQAAGQVQPVLTGPLLTHDPVSAAASGRLQLPAELPASNGQQPSSSEKASLSLQPDLLKDDPVQALARSNAKPDPTQQTASGQENLQADKIAGLQSMMKTGSADAVSQGEKRTDDANGSALQDLADDEKGKDSRHSGLKGGSDADAFGIAADSGSRRAGHREPERAEQEHGSP